MSEQPEIQTAGRGKIEVVNGIAYATDEENNVVPFAGFVQQNDPPPTNGGSGYPVSKGKFVPSWMLQSANANAYPTVGEGTAIGRYRLTPDEVDLWIRLKPGPKKTASNPGGSHPGTPSGSGTSRYYVVIPLDVPSPLDAAIGGSVRAWIAGTGTKEFTGVPGLSGSIGQGRVVVITLGGVAWGISHPKTFGPTSHITIHITYPL